MRSLKERYKKMRKWPKRIMWTIIVISIVVHIILPPIIKHVINTKLENMEGYYGYVEDIDISLIRGAYQIQDIHLYSDELGEEFPLLEMKEIDISIQWLALFKGSLVAEVEFIEPEIYFVVAPDDKKRRSNNFEKIQLTVFKDILVTQVPLQINRLEVFDGKVHYIDKSSSPNVEVQLSEMSLRINNLSNSLDLSETLISDFDFSSKVMKSATLEFDGSFDPYDENVSLNLDFELKKLNLKELNNMFLAYANFDVEKGEFSIYSEVEIEKGDLDGYVKPFIDDLDIVNYPVEKKKPLNLFWQALIGGSSKLIKNWSHDEIASKIPLKGTITDPKYGLISTIGNIFYHSIFHKLKPEIENKFNLKSATSNAVQEPDENKS